MNNLQRFLIAAIRFYQVAFSAWLGSSCRFEPSCSAYGLEAIQRLGAGKGSYLTLRRLARCHPLCQGGHDPVPRPWPSNGDIESASSHLSKKASHD